MSYGIVYALTSPTGRTYIGQTVAGLPTRWSSHKHAARGGEESRLYRAMRKHAPETWTKTVICECDSQEQLDEMEVFLISEFGEMNIQAGGNGRGPMSDETKGRISAIHKKNGYGPSAVAQRSARLANTGRAAHLNQLASVTGREQTPEQKAKQIAAQTGKKRTPEQRSRMSAAQKKVVKSPEDMERIAALGRAHKGTTQKPERIADRVAKLKGQKRTPEQRERIRAGKRANPMSAEGRANISAARAGKELSGAHRDKLSIAMKGKPWTAARRAAQEVRKNDF